MNKHQQTMDPGRERNADRISMLPDSILSHILSFLPTKYVVGTSILSRRWQFVWTSVPNLDFDDSLYFEESRKLIEDRRDALELSFAHCVNRVLLLTDVKCFQRFCLVLKKLVSSFDYEKSMRNRELVNLWICTAIKHNVQELDLCFRIKLFQVTLTRMVFTSEKLVRLNLSSGIFLDVPASVCLPSLKFLRLESIRYRKGNSAQKLFSGCPVLEELFIMRSLLDNCEVLSVSVATLKRLSVLSKPSSDLPLMVDERHNPVYMIRINCPNLENFFLKDFMSVDIMVENLSSLLEASIEVGLCCNVVSMANLLCGIASVKVMGLFGAIASFFSKVNNVLPTFHNMISLKLRADGASAWNVVTNFLDRSPNLEVLILKKGIIPCDSGICWNPPLRVPDCLFSHLNEFEVDKLGGLECEFEAIEYILKNAKVLKKMTIICQQLDANEEFGVRKKLARFPRDSRNCQLNLHF